MGRCWLTWFCFAVAEEVYWWHYNPGNSMITWLNSIYYQWDLNLLQIPCRTRHEVSFFLPISVECGFHIHFCHFLVAAAKRSSWSRQTFISPQLFWPKTWKKLALLMRLPLLVTISYKKKKKGAKVRVMVKDLILRKKLVEEDGLVWNRAYYNRRYV